MPKRSSTSRVKDINETAFSVVSQATTERDTGTVQTPALPVKNPAAVMLGRLGGLKGGKARAAKLSPKRRAQIAKMAAKKRWKTKAE